MKNSCQALCPAWREVNLHPNQKVSAFQLIKLSCALKCRICRYNTFLHLNPKRSINLITLMSTLLLLSGPAAWAPFPGEGSSWPGVSRDFVVSRRTWGKSHPTERGARRSSEETLGPTWSHPSKVQNYELFFSRFYSWKASFIDFTPMCENLTHKNKKHTGNQREYLHIRPGGDDIVAV